MKFITIAYIQKDDEGRRADKIFRTVLGKMPLSRIYKEIRSGFLRINGKKTNEDAKVSEGDTVDIAQVLIEFAGEDKPAPQAHGINRETFRKRIVFEDNDILVINKKKGELVHSDSSSKRFTPLDQLVREYLKPEGRTSISFSPGPLHRLDRNTSGLVAFGKTASGARDFSSALQHRDTRKCYIALLDGELDRKHIWKDKIIRNEDKNISEALPATSPEGDEAVTIAAPFFVSGRKTLAQVEIKTGRTHQIRCQSSYHKYPLTGDAKYHGSHNAEGYCLHSCCIIAGEKVITAMPSQEFMEQAALCMHCPPSQIKSACSNIISSFVQENKV